MKLSEIKSFIKLGDKELKESVQAIERSNSTIDKRNVVDSFVSYPLEDTNEDVSINVELTKNIKETINKKLPNAVKDGYSLLLSLLSLKRNSSEQRNHIISLEIESNEIVGFYVNTTFISEQLNMSNLYVDKLGNSRDLNESLNILIEMFINRVDIHFKNRYAKEDYTTYNVFKKIDLVKDIMLTIYGDDVYSIDNHFYLFETDDVNIKSNILKYVNNNTKINTNLYNYYKYSLKNVNPKIGSSVVKFKDDLGSESQNFAINELDKRITNIVGAAGSGKTHLASIIFRKYLYLSALNNKNYNTLYTTYSKYSLEQFLKYSEGYRNLVFVNDEESIKEKITTLSSPIDMDRYNKIKSQLTGINIDKINERYEEIDSKDEKLNKYYKTSLVKDEIGMIHKYCSYLEGSYQKPGFIDSILFALGLKESERIKIPNNLTKPLLNKGIKLPIRINELNLMDMQEKVKKSFFGKQKRREHYVSKLNLDDSFEDAFEFENTLNVNLDDLVYFLTYRPIVENPDKKNDYIQALHLASDRTKYKMDLLTEIYPIFSGLITHVADFDTSFKQVIVDESVLVPGYFFSLIMNRSQNIIAMGDVHQSTLQQSFFPNIRKIVDNIYGINLELSLSCQTNYDQESFFGHIFKLIPKDSTLVLTDNFRCNKEVYKLSKYIGGNQYDSYFNKYIDKHNLNCSVDDITHHYNENDAKVFHYKDEVFTNPFVFIDKNDMNRYKKVLELINQNRITREDLMVVVPFKSDIKRVRELIGDGIIIDIIENVQGIEKEVVIFDWNVSNVSDEAFKYIDKRKFNLMITRAKSIFITIADKDFIFNQSLDAASSNNGFIVINKFIRNSKFDKYELR